MIIPILFAPEITFICFILVIMDMVYTKCKECSILELVVILVIMDKVYTFKMYQYINIKVVILVIMDMVYTNNN